MIYETIGILRYSIIDIGYKLIVDIDQSIIDYYLKLIPKYKYVNRSRYKGHISVIRYEVPTNLEYWGKYESNEIIYTYDSFIKNDDKYYWLTCQSIDLNNIRAELGLPKYRVGNNSYHCTIGNIK